MTAYPAARRVTAVLGPTNTGKTYLAIERMLGHRTGMIGFPLRLLARENYDKVVRIKGRRRVALVTGEEKIVPPTADYFICTVESMPLERRVDFLAVDEVQLAADAERGHVFTDRMLHARGEHETMLLGADTIRPVIRALVPRAEYIGRPRFSSLAYTGPRKLARIPPRSAVVAFSASDVYALAEYIRHQRGGAAVVLGALSPRTRNAQVAMYQAGEVDYLVATDAIGMGLNMDVDHVTFSALRKFDGRRMRWLAAPEIAQIAGRAGRHMADGSFGTSAELGPLEAATVEAVENHEFEPLRSVWWRNPILKFDSVKTLLKSLDLNPPAPELMRMRGAEDHAALAGLARDDDILRLTSTPDTVRLLWDVCRIPDFRKTMTETHTRLLSRIFRHLAQSDGRLPTDWVARQLAQLDRTEGDIDTLMARIAHTRTWTYVSHRADWLDDSSHWQEHARAIEDRLSDALHQRLTQRFVDRRAATLSRLRGAKTLHAAVDDDGAVSVEGQFVGHLEGFGFVPDAAAASGEDRRMLVSAAKRALQGDMSDRVRRLEAEPAEAIALDDQHRLAWRGVAVARLVRGGHILSPRVELLPAEFLTPDLCDRARARLEAWLTGHLAAALAPLVALDKAALGGAARGLAFQLVEALGSLPRRGAHAQIAALSADERRDLRAMGVRLGLESVYLPRLLKPRAVRLRALLWAAWHGTPAQAVAMPPPPPGVVTTPVEDDVPAAFYEAVGYRVLGGRAVRIDILDRVAILIRRRTRKGPVAATADLLTPLGLTADQFAPVIAALGYRATDDGAGYLPAPRRRPPRKAAAAAGDKGRTESVSKKPGTGKTARRRPAAKIDPDSPFAKLRELRLS